MKRSRGRKAMLADGGFALSRMHTTHRFDPRLRAAIPRPFGKQPLATLPCALEPGMRLAAADFYSLPHRLRPASRASRTCVHDKRGESFERLRQCAKMGRQRIQAGGNRFERGDARGLDSRTWIGPKVVLGARARARPVIGAPC